MSNAGDKSKARMIENWWKRLAGLPSNLVQFSKSKLRHAAYSLKAANRHTTLSCPANRQQRLRELLTAQLSNGERPAPLTEEARSIIEQIRRETELWNRNNVTRTEGYRRFSLAHPEVHWALLAHMVSRNGGWGMTDLQGDLLPKLMTEAQAETVWLFLERSNALIFNDAYPQLLLYATSVRRRSNLFRLLPHLGVSSFMEPLWNQFLGTGDPVALTIGLIINEQNVVEQHVTQNSFFKQNVVDTLLFRLQSFLLLNQVVFPYRAAGTAEVDASGVDVEAKARQESNPAASAPHARYRLAGLTLEQFSDLDERIGFGKKLYSLLYAFPELYGGFRQFIREVPHTGSRADYWPHLFSANQKASPNKSYSERLNGCRLLPGAPELYSPALTQAWPDRPVEAPAPGDWFNDGAMLRHFDSIKPPLFYEMTDEYCTALNKIELAVLAKEAAATRKP